MVRGELLALFSTVEGITFRERIAPQGGKPHGVWKVIDTAVEQDPKREAGKIETTQCMLELRYTAQATEIDDLTDTLLQSVRAALFTYRASSSDGAVGYDAGTEWGTMVGFEIETYHPRIKDGANGMVDATTFILFIAQYRRSTSRKGKP